jgi:hypothetical protein
MPCCGQPRQPWGATRAPQPTETHASFGSRVARASVEFECLGDRALTVIGPITGTRYDFKPGGPAVPVDLRDRHAVAAVPRLREITRR